MALTSKNPVRVPQGRGSLWTLETKRQTNEHQDNQSFRFACSTRHFGRIVVRHQLVWVGATRVLAAARFGRGGGRLPLTQYSQSTLHGRLTLSEAQQLEQASGLMNGELCLCLR